MMDDSPKGRWTTMYCFSPSGTLRPDDTAMVCGLLANRVYVFPCCTAPTPHPSLNHPKRLSSLPRGRRFVTRRCRSCVWHHGSFSQPDLIPPVPEGPAVEDLTPPMVTCCSTWERFRPSRTGLRSGLSHPNACSVRPDLTCRASRLQGDPLRETDQQSPNRD